LGLRGLRLGLGFRRQLTAVSRAVWREACSISFRRPSTRFSWRPEDH